MANQNEVEVTHYDLAALNSSYKTMTACVTCECRYTTELIGGQPGGEEGVRHYAQHHLGLEDEALEQAVQRILHEEIGERDVTPPAIGEQPTEKAPELVEKRVYSLNIIRRDSFGPYLGDWMIKACLKQAASRTGLFIAKRGVKGDMAEAGRVYAYGPSLVVNGQLGPTRFVHLLDEHEDKPCSTYFKTILGKVSTPQGSKSIVQECEVAPPGTRFSFQYRFIADKLTDDQIVKIFSMAMNVGTGSAKSFEVGKFDILDMKVERPKK